jgi:spermidine synthase
MPRRQRSHRSSITLICLFFLLSGFSALIYQVAWVRMLSVSFGTTVYAISTVLTVFMAGLALGSYAFGPRADRWQRPLLAYGILELALAIYVTGLVVAMPWVRETTASLLRGRELGHTSTSLIKFAIACIVLIPPTTLMGGTLPLLAKFVTRSSRSIGKWLGRLYGLNTLGAVFGSLAAAYLLILHLGVNGTVLFAATLTGLVGLASCVLGYGAPIHSGSEETPTAEGDGAAEAAAEQLASAVPGSRLAFVHAVALGSGFITLSAEVFWTRLMVNFLSANVLVFATILGAFLTGIAVGSLLVSRWADRLRSLDVAVYLGVLASALLIGLSLLGQVWLGKLFQEIREIDGLSVRTQVKLSLAFMFMVVAIPATVFGTVLPLLFRWCSRSARSLGRNVGRLYAWNTLGAIIGSFVSGFVMVPFFGLNSSLLLLGLLYALLAVFVVARTSFRVVAGAVALALLVLIAIPSVRRPVYWFNGGFTTVRRLPEERTLYLAEGVEGSVGVLDNGRHLALTSNGVIIAESTLHDLWDLLLKAHLPMLFHENPKEVALVGLGAGVSLGAVSAYEEPIRIDVIEIAEEVIPAHKYFGSVNRDAWKDPRVKIWVNDGRHFLLTTENRYDVISVDPTDPPVVYQYTEDFMQLCHDRLSDGGIMVQWVPLFHLSGDHLKIIMNAFLNVFEHSTLWYDGTSILLMGRRGSPLEIDVPRLERRLQQPGVRESMAIIGSPGGWRLLATYAAGPEMLRRMVGEDVPENSDDRPYLEYAILRSDATSAESFANNLEMLARHFESAESLLIGPGRTALDTSVLRRDEQIIRGLLAYRVHRWRNQPEEARDVLAQLVNNVGLRRDELDELWPFYR